jgi:hypothetical protein
MDGPQAGTSATADATGDFQLTGTFDETTRFRASKDGHAAATRTFSVYGASRYISFELEVTGPSVNLAGAYDLTVNVEGACDGFPEELRTRSYAVTLTPSAEGATTAFALTFTGAPFVENYRRALVGVAGNDVASWLGDGHGTPGLVERLAPNTFLAFDGLATATVGVDPATITASLEGTIEYCERRSDLGSRYDCDPAQAVTHVRCTAKHMLTLTRR